jgi:hypothetical protein
MPEIIDLGSIELKFLQSKDDTAGNIDMFEMTLQPNARMPIAHYHDRWDETIYGLAGTTTWRVAGKEWRPAKPSSSNAASCTALRIALRRPRRVFAFSARECSVRSISRTWQVFWRLRRPIRHG